MAAHMGFMNWVVEFASHVRGEEPLKNLLELNHKINMTDQKIYTYEDVRNHRSEKSGWMAIDGKVYDVTKFAKRHPGGNVLATGLGRDATTLFYSHHNLSEKMPEIEATMAKMQIGVIKDYKAVTKFDTPFAKVLLERCRAAIKGKPHRDSFYTYTALLFYYTAFALTIFAAFYTGSLWVTPMFGLVMSVGHLAGHSGNHYSLSSNNALSKFISMTCTSMWGLREKYWEFSHLISHHCYNYSDRDYVMEQHVPMQYFRVRHSDPWKPVHAYQHYVYMTTPFTAFIVGALRFDCFPWILLGPILGSLRRNGDSFIPAPQFFASGSNVEERILKNHEDGVGPERFVVFDTYADMFLSLFLSNIIWLPLFFHTWHNHGIVRALLMNSIGFGVQAALATKSLLTQHLSENVQLKAVFDADDDWYVLQIEGSTTVERSKFELWMTFVMSYQTEHHLFPALNPALLILVQPVIEQTCKEFGVGYNHMLSMKQATDSVYTYFKMLSVKPAEKTL